MNSALHVSYTWLLSHLLQPLIVLGWAFVQYGNFSGYEFLILFSLLGIIASLPALVVLTLIISPLKRLAIDPITKAVLWLLILLASVLLSFFIVVLFFQFPLDLKTLQYVIPALVAIVLAYFFRLPQLAEQFTSSNLKSDEAI